MGPLTGTSGEYGQTALQATKLAISDFEKSHPKCKVGIVQYDDQADPSQAPGLARQAVSDQKVVAINGPAFTGPLQAAEPIFESADMPTVAGSATGSSLAHSGWKVFHRTIVNDGQEGPATAKYIVDDMHYKRLAVIDNQQPYGKGLADNFAASAKQLGATVVDRESIDINGSDYSSTVNHIRAAKPQAVFCGCLDPEGSRLLKQMRQAGVETVYSGGSGLHTAHFLSGAGKSAADGTIAGTGGADPSTSASGRAWLARWKKAFGGPPAIYGVEYYDASMSILQAIGAGKTSRSAINSYMSTEHFQGPSGPVSFQSDGNIASAKVNIYKVVNGAFKFEKSISASPN